LNFYALKLTGGKHGGSCFDIHQNIFSHSCLLNAQAAGFNFTPRPEDGSSEMNFGADQIFSKFWDWVGGRLPI
jgi:hypothetical protein